MNIPLAPPLISSSPPFLCLTLMLFLAKLGTVTPAIALPPPQDTPEEILRTEIITEGRSPIDGKLLTPGEYAQLQEQFPDSSPEFGSLQPPGRNNPAQAPEHIMNQLPVREVLRRIFPF